MKRNLFLVIGIIALLFPMSLTAQQGPKISGFAQGLWTVEASDGHLKGNNTFQARRVRMSIDGTLVSGLTYKIQGDFTRKPMLVDVYMKYKACDEFAIQVGQFKTPFTLESPINPVNLEIFDYGESVQNLSGYNDVCGVGSLGRDLGVMFTGDLFKPYDEDFSIITYSIGVFNGNGANEKDNNNRKDFVGRLEVRPWLEDLTLTGSYYLGWFDNGNKNIHNGKRQRWSAGAQYNDGGLLIRAEYLNGLTGDPEGTLDNNGNLTEFSSEGYYAVAGYNIRFGKNDSQKMMPVFRFEHFAKDIAVVGGATDYYTIGLNYWPVKSLNLKLDFSLIQPKTGSNSHRVVGMLSYKF